MKVFRNGLCYVTYKELKKESIPEFMVLNKLSFDRNEFVIFADTRSIDYVRSRKDILDYDEVKSLTEEAMDLRLSDIFKRLQACVTRLNNPDPEKVAKCKSDSEFMTKFKSLEAIYYGLLDYRLNKSSIDERIRKQTNPEPSFGAR